MKAVLSITTKTILHNFSKYFPNIGICQIMTEDESTRGEIVIEAVEKKNENSNSTFRRDETFIRIKNGREHVFEGTFQELINKLKSLS